MASYTSGSVPAILVHHQAKVVDGRKEFGEYDGLVETGTKTSELVLNPGQSEVAVIISTMDRERCFKETFSRIVRAIGLLGIAARVAIMDNSIKSGLENKVHSWTKTLANECLETVIYHHNPRMIQSTARNLAFEQFTNSVETIAIWDGDIYCGPETFRGLSDAWKAYPQLTGIAPVMVGYTNGSINETIIQHNQIADRPDLRRKSHMPGEIGEQIWVREGNVMRATLMRGAFWIKRSLIESVAANNPQNVPWLPDFVVWQNVPFFIAARELGHDFAYALDPRTIVAHDDRVDDISIGFRLPLGKYETLKSITMLAFRNRVFTQDGRTANPRFWEYNLSAISRISDSTSQDGAIIQDRLLDIAGLIEESDTSEVFRTKYQNLRHYIPLLVQEICDKMIESICSGHAFERIKVLQSLKPLRMIYSVED